MLIEDAIEIVKYCPEAAPNGESESCEKCPLIQKDMDGYTVCDHIRAIAEIIGDTSI